MSQANLDWASFFRSPQFEQCKLQIREHRPCCLPRKIKVVLEFPDDIVRTGNAVLHYLDDGGLLFSGLRLDNWTEKNEPS